ncbi:right-handed parallel beta-helix repeat-containing protein [Rhodopirellula sp. SWK7]|uniref:right-handed parallel beta-helix repeat-containing protein n=1 Tax=Rhodopirellula sp. SWK7 TaxID=595460 RepID=UPI0002BEA708|nr:right-handed parallel beta-helix repeat-containing protein [Rhodopirellula sp. SWK7]EMI43681.1 hypothetical protein RRSWK_03843 [Rhodopirellula sp. SWK7]
MFIDKLNNCFCPLPQQRRGHCSHYGITLLLFCVAIGGSLFSVHRSLAFEIHLSPNGDDSASGSVDAPLRTLEAAKQAVNSHNSKSVDEDVTIWVHAGRYPIEETVKFGKEFSGTREHPVRIRAVAGQTPVFDAGLKLDLAEARLIDDTATLARLAPIARTKTYVIAVDDQRVIDSISSAKARCSIDGQMMSLARYPNVGFGHIAEIKNKGAIYIAGRTFGDPPTWSLDAPVGAQFTLADKDVSAWEQELRHARKATLSGYLAHDWCREELPLANVQGNQVQLGGYTRYGVIDIQKLPRRIRVSNLLCELDAEGEFYFDDDQNQLYFIPPSPIRAKASLSIWGGPGLAHFHDVAHVSVEGIVIESVGRGKSAVLIEDCSNVVLTACTIRNSSRTGVTIEGGSENGLRSCDLYDVAKHVSIGGGDVKRLEPAGNFAINCHFTQIAANDYYGGISISGVGNRFRNNLVHNFPGQVLVFKDCEHVIELNEFFNIGFEEGDGGALYTGASMWSWGNQIRNNFIHHLMCLPKAHPRGGVYLDDLDQGDTVEGNVFYKAAHRAVLVNGGAGQNVRDNIFLKCHIGIYNCEVYAEMAYRAISRFDSGELKRGDKDDRIWRTEQVIGKQGWNREPWSSRYPLFGKIMNQDKMRFFPIECEFTGNRFAQNWTNFEYRVPKKVKADGVKDIDEVHYIKTDDNLTVAMKVFRNPATLDFRYRVNKTAPSMPKIPFDNIGLQKDEGFRDSVPRKHLYRAAIRKRFERQASYDAEAKYDPKKINTLMYFNTGKLLSESGGLLHAAASQDESTR